MHLDFLSFFFAVYFRGGEPIRHNEWPYFCVTPQIFLYQQKMWEKWKVVWVYLFLMHCRFKTLQKHTDIPSPLLKKILDFNQTCTEPPMGQGDEK